MPDVSIAIKATDRFSDAMKTMKDSADKFDKSIVGMQSRLNSLNRNKATLKVDTDRARTELRSAEKQFAATGDAISELVLQEKQLTFENARRNLSLVSKEAANVEKQMLKTGNSVSKIGNKAGEGFSTIVQSVATAGGAKMIGSLAQDSVNTLVGSMLGSNGGNVFSSALSSAISGAAIGSMIPGIGTAVGAVAGGLVGMASGSVQNWSKKDDAFKSYVQNAVEEQLNEQTTSLTSGSALAASRETDQISFATLFKGEDKAKQYLADLVQMADTTPFLYDDLTAMSKTLATYGYDENSILPVLQTIGDAGAALGQSTSDMNSVATAIGRMKSSNKTTLEYLNILNDRGIGAVGMLANAYGVDQGEVYSMISKGQIAGQDAARIILDALTDSFAGSMERQSKTFSGITSTIEGLRQELDNAMGEGYNETRMAGLQAEREWLEGDSGQEMQEAYQAIGAWKASLENAKEQYIRDAVNEAMGSDAYKAAEAEGNAAEMGRIIMKAKIDGMNQYNANEGKDEVLAQELSLIDSVREDTSLNDSYWDAGYTLGLSFSKGRAAGMMGSGSGETSASASPSRMLQGVTLPSGSSYAVGIDYVPYDTHIDKGHIHNHIIFCAVNFVDYHKYNSNKRSYYGIRNISDKLCRENGLSVVVLGKGSKGKSYAEYQAEKVGTSWKGKLKIAVDTLIPQVASFEELLQRLQAAGYEIKPGKYISCRAPGQERFTRLKTLGADYTEEAIKERIEGKRTKAAKAPKEQRGVSLLIDIENSIKAAQSRGYEQWAKIHNLKLAAKTMNFLTEHKIEQYADLISRIEEINAENVKTTDALKSVEKCLADMAVLMKHVTTYQKTKPVYEAYRRAKDKDAYRAKQESSLILHEAAVKTLKAAGITKLPNLAAMQEEYEQLQAQKEALYADYGKLKKKVKEYDVIKQNIDSILRQGKEPERGKEAERG